MVIFQSYVSLPEGITLHIHGYITTGGIAPSKGIFFRGVETTNQLKGVTIFNTYIFKYFYVDFP
jgi:hypothetical protein